MRIRWALPLPGPFVITSGGRRRRRHAGCLSWFAAVVAVVALAEEYSWAACAVGIVAALLLVRPRRSRHRFTRQAP